MVTLVLNFVLRVIAAVRELAADAAHIGIAVEFFDTDLGPNHPIVQETGLRDPLFMLLDKPN